MPTSVYGEWRKVDSSVLSRFCQRRAEEVHQRHRACQHGYGRSMEQISVELERVPETMLWTLYHRAVEARRPDAVLADPLAVELVDRIDFPFAERFGDGERLSQWQALRARCFDDTVSRFLAARPSGTVVALGEGL